MVIHSLPQKRKSNPRWGLSACCTALPGGVRGQVRGACSRAAPVGRWAWGGPCQVLRSPECGAAGGGWGPAAAPGAPSPRAWPAWMGPPGGRRRDAAHSSFLSGFRRERPQHMAERVWGGRRAECTGSGRSASLRVAAPAHLLRDQSVFPSLSLSLPSVFLSLSFLLLSLKKKKSLGMCSIVLKYT